MKFTRSLITVLLFPLTFSSVLTGSAIAHSYGVAAGQILALATLTTVLIVTLGEKLHPHYPSWGKNQGDIPTDIMHNLVSIVMIPQLLDIFLKAVLLTLAAKLTMALGFSSWPHHWWLPLQLVFAMGLSQFGEYWVHRLLHEIPFLWRFHAIHHSAPRLYWLNAGRFHPVDAGALYVVALTPLLLLGAGEEVMLLYTVWASIHGLFQHCNIDLKLGPLNYIFSMAELHRWHHSRKLEEANANYGNNIIFWDIIFGTMFYPKDRTADEDIGLQDMPNFPQTYWAQVLSPLGWSKLK